MAAFSFFFSLLTLAITLQPTLADSDPCGYRPGNRLIMTSECQYGEQTFKTNSTKFLVQFQKDPLYHQNMTKGISFWVKVHNCSVEFTHIGTDAPVFTISSGKKFRLPIEVNVTENAVYAFNRRSSRLVEVCKYLTPFNGTQYEFAIGFSESFQGVRALVDPFTGDVPDAHNNCSSGPIPSVPCEKKESKNGPYERFWKAIPLYVWILLGVVVFCVFIIPGLILCSWCICPCVLLCCSTCDSDPNVTITTVPPRPVSRGYSL